MSNWIAITKETLYEAKIAIIIDLCDTLLLKDGQDNRVDGIIAGVVSEVRTSVASCVGNRVDSDTTKIPGNLRDLTVDLIVARLKGAIETELTEDERSNLTWRRGQLEDVASCKIKVDAPDAPIDAPIDSPVPPPSFGPGRCREFTRQKQDGR